MRKYTFVVLAVALLFAMGMMAQTSSGSSGTSSQYPGSSDQTGMQSGSQAGSSGSAKAKTVEGCIVRQATEFYIYPRSGQPEHISSSGQNVSAHLGHHVKLHGTEQPFTSASTSGTSGGTAGTTGSASASNTSGSSTGTAGSMSGNTAGAGSPAAASSQEFVVERVDMVSETCPASIKNNAQASGLSITPQ